MMRQRVFASRGLAQGKSTESPLPLWERDRVRGLAPVGADESIARTRGGTLDLTRHAVADGPRSSRAAARDPSPCPSPTRGEGTLHNCPASQPTGVLA